MALGASLATGEPSFRALIASTLVGNGLELLLSHARRKSSSRSIAILVRRRSAADWPSYAAGVKPVSPASFA
jgi:hypothetical protein